MDIIGNIDSLDMSGFPKPGVYPFRILSAEESLEVGHEKLTLALEIQADDGNYPMMDAIDADDVYKLKRFTDSVDLQQSFLLGDIQPEECVGRSGWIRVMIHQKSPLEGEQSSVQGLGYELKTNTYMTKEEAQLA